MLFNSVEFIFFLPAVIISYYLLPHKARWVLLLAASYYFYMAWRPEYIVLIIFSTLIDYFAGIMIEKNAEKRIRRALLLLSLVSNLGLLFVFKYFNFFNQEAGKIFELVTQKEYPIAALRLLLPIGISFYTFQTLSYTIDVYRGRKKAEKHLGYFALYVTFFPQLVAGPIERSDRLLPQLRMKHSFDYQNTAGAILRICWGFFKKVVIADRVAVIVNTVYGDLPSFTGAYLWTATLGFALQIYCDFSAYSDIAIGSAGLLGIDLMENFKVPYLSKSISEFWSRWHISLSTWFRDYLYIPIGGNRVDKKWKLYRNLMIVFVVSGLWHGAAWTFLIWGSLHGIYLVCERLIEKARQKRNRPPLRAAVTIPFTFFLVLVAWVFFRAENISDAAYVFTHLTPANLGIFTDGALLYKLGLDKKELVLLFASSVWLIITDWFRWRKDDHQLIKGTFYQGAASVLLAVFILIFGYYGAVEASEFIYFQF